MRVQVIGCNHRTASMAVRERVAFDAPAAGAALRRLVELYPEIEAALLSTCNRVELYIARPVHGRPRWEDALAFLARERGLDAKEVGAAFYQHQDEDAVRHLMHVAGSLDSMVLGETQILGQVRAALEWAREAGSARAVLTRLFHDAVSAAKRMHSETGLSSGRASVASVAVQFAREIFSNFADKTVMIVGAGKMGEQTLARLIELGPGGVLVVNRSHDRAQKLASSVGGQAMDLSRLPDALAQADIVVTSTGASEPVITAGMMRAAMRARRYRPIFLIDIAMPRDVHPDVGRIEQVYLYNIDDLQRVVEDTLDGRAQRVGDAEAILSEHAEQFMTWLRARAVGPTIGALCARLADLRDEELSWLLPKLSGASPRDRELIEQFAHRLIKKVLHDPVQTLTEACEPGALSADMYAQSLIQLFNLRLDDSEAGGS